MSELNGTFVGEHIDVALTGHRPAKLFGYDLNHPGYGRLMTHLESVIEQYLRNYRTVTIRSGMALGADTIWALAALTVKGRVGQRLRLIAHIPFESQPSAWSPQDRRRWEQIRSMCDEEVITYRGRITSRTEAGRWLNQRNRDMIAPAHHLIAIFDGSKGGTANAVRDGKSVGKAVTVFHPAMFA